MVDTKAVEEEGSDKEDADEAGLEGVAGREKVDLTLEQKKVEDDDNMEEMDDFDLLDASLDPTDVRSLKRRMELETEIEYEQVKIKSKLLWKIALSESNPLRVDE